MQNKTGLRRKVANNIKKVRSEVGLTQEEASFRAGLHYKYYQRIESGSVNLTLDSVEKISKAFSVPPKSLFD